MSFSTSRRLAHPAAAPTSAVMHAPVAIAVAAAAASYGASAAATVALAGLSYAALGATVIGSDASPVTLSADESF